MKYIIILGDGMADLPVMELNNKTPLEVAKKPTIDMMANKGNMGIVKTVPDGIAPGSDVANLSVMGYDPEVYYSGRSPLEAVSMGINLSDEDVSFRCNFITLSDEENYTDKVMVDYCADEISTSEAKVLIEYLNENLSYDYLKFYPGIYYRHLLVWNNAPYDFVFTPPHDITEQKITDYLPRGPYGNFLLDIHKKCYKLLKNHPINIERMKRGLNPANSIWLWGEGKKPLLTSFTKKYNMKGSVISAVDLVKGIGICAGLNVVEVEGATGNIHTNFSGKAKAVIDELKNGRDFVYIHIEAPDECGHRHEIENKVKSIELIDEKVVSYIKNELDNINEEYRILILPDHATPLCTRTHSSDPVPFIIYDSRKEENHTGLKYDENCAQKTGYYIEKGYTLMDKFLEK